MIECMSVAEIQLFASLTPDMLWSVVNDAAGRIIEAIAHAEEGDVSWFPWYEDGADAPYQWCRVPQGDPV